MICVVCGKEFSPPPKRAKIQKCCSKSCGSSLAWRSNYEARRLAISVRQKARGAEVSEQNRMRWAQPGARERQAERNRALWADPEYRARVIRKLVEVNNRPEKLQHNAQVQRTLRADPAWRARASEAQRARWRDPIYRRRMMAAIRNLWDQPGYRERASAVARARWQDPEYRARVLRQPPPPPVPVTRIPIPLPPARQEIKTAARIAEEAEIAAFIRSKGVTMLPPVGDPALANAPEPVLLANTFRFKRRRAA